MDEGVHEQEEPESPWDDPDEFFEASLQEFHSRVKIMVKSDLFHTDAFSAAVMMCTEALTAAMTSPSIGEGKEEELMAGLLAVVKNL